MNNLITLNKLEFIFLSHLTVGKAKHKGVGGEKMKRNTIPYKSKTPVVKDVGFGRVFLALVCILTMVAFVMTLLAWSRMTELVDNQCQCIDGQNGTDGQNATCPPEEYLAYSDGVAVYMRTLQAPNSGKTPGQAFGFDTNATFNDIPLSVQSSSGLNGTVFSLGSGLYEIHFECSLSASGSLALYTGPNISAISPDPTTVTGSLTGSSWVHGISIQNVLSSMVLIMSPYNGSTTVTTAGNAFGIYMVRITFIKLS